MQRAVQLRLGLCRKRHPRDVDLSPLVPQGQVLEAVEEAVRIEDSLDGPPRRVGMRGVHEELQVERVQSVELAVVGQPEPSGARVWGQEGGADGRHGQLQTARRAARAQRGSVALPHQPPQPPHHQRYQAPEDRPELHPGEGLDGVGHPRLARLALHDLCAVGLGQRELVLLHDGRRSVASEDHDARSPLRHGPASLQVIQHPRLGGHHGLHQVDEVVPELGLRHVLDVKVRVLAREVVQHDLHLFLRQLREGCQGRVDVFGAADDVTGSLAGADDVAVPQQQEGQAGQAGQGEEQEAG